MKLLLIYIALLFLVLVTGTASGQTSSDEEVTVEVVVPSEQIAADHPCFIAENNWLRGYFFMLRVLNPVKQLDLPGDYKSCSNIPCRALNSSQRTSLIEQQEESYISEYMRLLSVRYSDGFYIYSLSKLII